MAGARPILALAALLLLAGGMLLQFFIILSGGVNSSPLNQFYFLQASTAGIANARNPSRWTSFAICGVGSNGRNVDCGSPIPALPFDPPRNFASDPNVPEQFVGTRQYFYMSRFMFVFYLVALIFALVGLLTGILALVSRLGGYISALAVSAALFFHTVAAVLMTTWVVRGRNAFRRAGVEAHVGRKVMAFAWTTFTCFVLATLLLCVSSALASRDSGMPRRRSTRSSRRSRGSFLDTEPPAAVKDDYA